MFLCTRQIDIHERFGIPRIAFMSIVGTIIMFLFSYEVMYFLVTRHYQINIFDCACTYIFMHPLHKGVHLLFFLPFYKSFRIHKLTRKKWIPYFNTYVNTPIHKVYFCINLILPFILISSLFIFYVCISLNMDIIVCFY